MNKKGYTLMEVLAVIVILGIVATITTALIGNLIQDAKKNAFRESVFSAMRAYQNEESKGHFEDLGEVNITELPISNNPIKSGKVKRNVNNEIVVINATNNVYCANGSRNNLTIVLGECPEESNENEEDNQEENSENNNETNNNEENN